MAEEKRLIQFYGTECTHCHEMDPLVEKLEKEESVKVTKIEVWHNAENAKFLKEVDDIDCGGVPFFYNEKTGKKHCGSMDYEALKAWAKG